MAKARRGRPAEPDKGRISAAIAGLVYQYQAEHGASLNEARERVADDLSVSVDTVRRAWREMKGPAAWAGALSWELNLQLNPTRYTQALARVKRRLTSIKAARGI